MKGIIRKYKKTCKHNYKNTNKILKKERPKTHTKKQQRFIYIIYIYIYIYIYKIYKKLTTTTKTYKTL